MLLLILLDIIFITSHVSQLYWVSRAKLPQSLNTPASILTPSRWGCGLLWGRGRAARLRRTNCLTQGWRGRPASRGEASW